MNPFKTLTVGGKTYTVTDPRTEENMQYSRQSFANALKGTATGKTVDLTDISSVPHSVEVQVTGTSNPTAVTVTCGSKNLVGFQDYTLSTVGYQETCKDGMITRTFNVVENVETTFMIMTAAFDYAKTPQLEPGTYVFSMTNHYSNNGRLFLDPYAELTLEDGTILQMKNGVPLTLEHRATVTGFRSTSSKFPLGTMYSYTLQIEKGTEATEHMPFREPESYRPDAQGKLEVPSKAPGMVFHTDSSNAVLNIWYNRDADKVIDRLTQAIRSLGAEV